MSLVRSPEFDRHIQFVSLTPRALMPILQHGASRLLLVLCVAAAGPRPAGAQAQSQSTEQKLQGDKLSSIVKSVRAKGEPIQGGILFYQPQLSCTKCHTCGGKEGESPLGPDLARPEAGGTSIEKIVESLLNPSQSIRHGYEAVTVSRRDGTVVTGLLKEERKNALVLSDPRDPGRPLVIPKDQIDERAASQQSLMPSGQVNLLRSKQQFYDLVAFLSEAAEFGPARARALRPDPLIINPPLPAYESNLDHAGLIRQLDEDSYRRGEALYGQICASCHGTHDGPGSMPTSLRFAEGKFRNGHDPASLYATLTRGFGMMAAQTALVPRQKYDVIHYIREAYLKTHNPSQYDVVDDRYLSALPKGTSLGPERPQSSPWLAMDYGCTLTATYGLDSKDENIAYKGIAFRLDSGPGGVTKGNSWMVFEHDTLRMAAVWTGKEFLDWNGINFNGKHEVHPRVGGTIQFETASGPGWADPETGSFAEMRVTGRDGRRYGPLPRTWGRYRGLYQSGDQAVVSYTVGQAEILESPGLARVSGRSVFTRSFEIGPHGRPLILRVFRRPSGESNPGALQVRRAASGSSASFGATATRLTAGVVGEPTGAEWSAAEDGHLLFRIPADSKRSRLTIWMASVEGDQGAAEIGTELSKSLPADRIPTLMSGGPRRWKEAVTTTLEQGSSERPFAADTLPLPIRNPWGAQLRLTGLDFRGGGKELLVSTWDGDVWSITGLESGDRQLNWRRIASGLFQPLGLKIIDDVIYVNCRDQIAILRDLNDDGETDFYECFNSDHQVTESFHEFAMGLQTDAEGRFYYTKAARHGKPAVVPHHGTLLRVARDGSSTEILATGFRAPNGVCVNADGTFFVTDQEGHWVPKNRINWIRDGKRFYGNIFGYTDVTDVSDSAQEEPLCWITNRFDRSPAELIRVTNPAWKALDGKLLNLSYGQGKVFVVPHEPARDGMQGGMIALPLPPFPTGVMRGRFSPGDGHLYLCGMYAWAGNQQSPGGLYRLRATGKPAYVPVEYHVTRDGLMLTFSDPLQPESCEDPRNFGLRVWDLNRTPEYGSEHIGERTLKVTAANLSADGRTVTLTIPELRPTRGLELWYSIIGADGQEVDGLFDGTVNSLGQ